MPLRQRPNLADHHSLLRNVLLGPLVLAFLPAMALGAYWLGREWALVIVAIAVPLLVLLAGGATQDTSTAGRRRDRLTGLPVRDALETMLSDTLYKVGQGGHDGHRTACILVSIEDFDRLEGKCGSEAADHLIARVGERLHSALRENDLLCHYDTACFGIALGRVSTLNLETMIQLASRIQTTAEEPVSLDGQSIYLSCAVGFALSPRRSYIGTQELITRAETAMKEAIIHGPSAIRAYSEDMGHRRADRAALGAEAIRALEHGQIIPWFQPQISTDTGEVTGFEALARWNHPERGMVPPADFLPELEAAGMMERLGEVILYQALNAIKAWDGADVYVPRVGVNFTGEELENPKLAEKIQWDLDRFDLGADRLCIEILESVVAETEENTIARNISQLAKMGCPVDLDDFGTGQASINAIRRFDINRIKIDRSFIQNVDRDSEQQKMVSAILTMSERLGLETLAEGVETAGEHAMLAQLGCGHVQGFGLGRPMPFEETIEWVRRHNARLAPPPAIGGNQG